MSQLVGGIRIGQLRVKPRDCAMPLQLHKAAGVVCHGGWGGRFSLATEDKADFGHNRSNTSNSNSTTAQQQAFRWHGQSSFSSPLSSSSLSAVEEERSHLFGGFTTPSKLNDYPPVAYTVMLPNRGYADAAAIIKDLEVGRYLDRSTRVVTVEFAVYNAMLDLWAVVRLAGEMTPAGGVVPTVELQTHNL